MKSPDRDRYLIIGIASIYLAIVGLAFSLGVGWRVFHWAAGV